MRKFIKSIVMAFFVATVFVSAEALAVSPVDNGRSGLEGASYLASYNHHTVAIRNGSSSPTVGRHSDNDPMIANPSPSSLALFSTALVLLGLGGLARRRGRR